MINVIVFNFKKVFKYLRFFILIIVSAIILFILYSKYNINIDYMTYSVDNKLNSSFSQNLLSQNIPGILEISNLANKNDFSIVDIVLFSEIPIMKLASLNLDSSLDLEKENTSSTEEKPSIVLPKDNVKTEVIPNNVPNNYTNSFNGVEIKNGTSYNLDENIFYSPLEINRSNIIIFHTHTCESYTPSDKYPYEESGNFRTIDLNYSVARVGLELNNYLLSYGYNVIHDTTYHDYPSYSGSYGRSMATVENILSSNPNTDIIIDIHRDAIEDTSYNPSVKIGDEIVSQLMFVIGTDGGGLEHPNWQNNLNFAVKVQEKANELYPGLFKPILLRNSRYNEHLGNAACIIEVGATGNTLDESILSMKYLSKVLDEVLKQ